MHPSSRTRAISSTQSHTSIPLQRSNVNFLRRARAQCFEKCLQYNINLHFYGCRFARAVAAKLQQFRPRMISRCHGLGGCTNSMGIKKMKKVLLVTASLLALGAAAPAMAADLAARPYTKAPAYVAAVYDWSGFYVGANGGWGSSRKCWDTLTPAGAFLSNEGCHDATGGTAGGQIGYRWQSGTWVFGIEGQGNWADF